MKSRGMQGVAGDVSESWRENYGVYLRDFISRL